MKGLIGKKIGMTQVYDEKGSLTPVTVLQAGPCVVLNVKTKEKDGYSALQLGFGSGKAKNESKAVLGTCKKAGCDAKPPRKIGEIRLEADPEAQVGAELKSDLFAANEYVDVSGITKGKGYQGVVRRHNFAGGRASHGGGWHRRTGSIGQKEMPGNVIKGKRMPGQMGNDRRTIQNLRIVKVSQEDSLVFVKGAVPGPNGGIVFIKSAKKKNS